jgi:Protein of unknown function (DUF3987)/Bifunctional DNA primase/polymerase, N-terminal
MTAADVLARRQRYWANGYRPLELWNHDATVNDRGEPLTSPGKQPRGAGWQKRAMQNPPEAVRLQPDLRALNTGLLCSEKLVGVDVDVPIQSLADQIVNLAETAFEPTPLVRIGLPPKILLAYRVETAFGKMQTPELFLPDGTKCKVELLARGQQFVADGIHPDTGEPYFWTGETPETVPLDDLPSIGEEKARAFIENADRLLRLAGAKEKEKPRPKYQGNFFAAVNRAALADIKAWVTALFPKARFQPGTGAWRISSADLGRDLEEDISIAPGGIKDFGREEALTAIDLVITHHTAATATEAALWLCDHLRITPETLGWVGRARRYNPPPAGDPSEAWPEPAKLLDQTPTPPFPIEFLPGKLGEFAAQQAFDLQVPRDFIGIPLVITAATAIGKQFRMAPKAQANWAERACFWGGIIGYVGDGKTPSFNTAFTPIWALQAKFRDQFHEAFDAYQSKARLARLADKQWEKETKAALAKGQPAPERPAAAEPPEKPVLRQLVTNDATQEKIAELMQENPRGFLLYRDELSGWFRSFNQYRPGADEQFFLQCHAGGPWLQHRRSGDFIVPDVYLNICGGFQPDVVAEALARRPGKADSGMAARFSLLVWPDPIARRWVDNSPDREALETITWLFDQLLNKDPEAFVGPRLDGASHFPPLRFTPEGQAMFRDWYIAHHQALDELEPDAALKGHFAKYDGLFASLALVHHLIRHTLGEAVQPARVDEHTAFAVRGFIDAYLRPHARKIYHHLGHDPGFEGAKKIAQWIVTNPEITSFTKRDISHKGWTGLTGRDENTGRDFLRAALAHLDNVAGWVRAEDIPAGPRGGRPTTLYLVNPRIVR